MEGEDSASASECEDNVQNTEEVLCPLDNQNGGNNSTEMGSEDCASTSSSNTTQHSPEEMDRGNTSSLVEAPLRSPTDGIQTSGKSTDLGNKSCTIIPSSEDTTPCLAEVPVPLKDELSGTINLNIDSESCTLTPVSQDTTPCPVEVSMAVSKKCSDSDNLNMESEGYDITPVSQNTTPSPVELSVSVPNQCRVNYNLDMESGNYIPTSITQDTTPSHVEESVSVPSKCNDSNNFSAENEDCAVTSIKQDTTPSSVEVSISVPKVCDDNSNFSMENEDCAVTCSRHDTTISLLNQDKGASRPPASPSHLETALPATDNLTDTSSPGSGICVSKSRQKFKKGLKRKNPSVNKGIQTSIHLLDSNSTFHDRIVDLDALRRETGVVRVEDLQDLDVTLEEWPMLLVSQLRLRDTIINNLNGVICELVECGQALEQDLDYLKLKTLELQQETKRRAKEDQQSHRSKGKETESQTTEEDFNEAWSRWYYGCWGDYYSESDPTSSMYWPGHYMQQSTVASGDVKGEETQQQVGEKEETEEMRTKIHEEVNSEKDTQRKKKKKNKEKESCYAESDTKSSEKRKKLKAKRKERHKSEKPSKEPVSTEKESIQPQDANKKIKKKDRGKDKRKEKSNDDSHVVDCPVGTQPSQEDITSTTSITKQIGSEEEEGKTHGWDTSQSITQQVASVAAQAVVDSGYVFQEELGLYYDYNTGYYYNAENGLYYDTKSGTYFYYDHTTQSYQFHSQVSPTTTNNNKHRKKKTTKKKSTKLSSKNEDTEDKEDGECTESDDDEQEEVEEEGESEDEQGKERDTASPNNLEEEVPGGVDIQPSLRLMVVEGAERVRVGELHMVTLSGGTVGREATNAVHLPDLNVSKLHAEIEYRSTGADDHHYFLRDLGSNNGTFVNGVRLSEAREASKEVEVGHGWEVQFGPIKVKCHLHPGNLTCNECEPGLVLHTLPSGNLKPEAIASFKNAKSKERARRKELKAMQKKYKLTQRDPQPSSTPAPGYTDRTLLRQAEKGSDNPYEKTEVATSETPLKETNRGFALLQKMGWSQGQGLGKAESGRTEPINPVSVVGTAGLGSSQPAIVEAPNRLAKRKRQQLQITQERYKQSTVGH